MLRNYTKKIKLINMKINIHFNFIKFVNKFI